MKEGIVVHLGANPGFNNIYRNAAKNLGRYLAQKEIPLVYGGSCDGCMGALADGCLENNGIVIGVMPTYIEWKRERVHTGITELIEVASMAERKREMTIRSFGAIAMPGAFGTLDEIFEYMTSTQLRGVMMDSDYPIRKFRPAGFYSINEYYHGLVKFLDEKCVAEGFLTPESRQIFIHSDELTIVDQIQEAAIQLNS